MINLDRICDKKDCIGCFACYNICPKNAIEMKEEKLGHIYPEINVNKCINCNLCKKICPSNKNFQLREPLKAYAMISKDEKIRKNSTSGGAATVFALGVIEKGGVVYGANNIENGKFNFIRINEKEMLKKIKDSKYVQCYINDMHKKVREDMDRGV